MKLKTSERLYIKVAREYLKKITLALYCVFVTTNTSSAAWVTLITMPGYSFSIEESAISRTENKRHFWSLINKPRPDRTGKSGIGLNEINCSTKEINVLYIRFHSDLDGKGLVTEEQTQVRHNVTGFSPQDETKIVDFVCKRYWQ